MASNFANTADNLVFIRWETCGGEISRIINEFEEIENSTNHHENFSSFTGKFYKDIKTLYEALPVNRSCSKTKWSAKSMIRLLTYQKIPMSPCQQ